MPRPLRLDYPGAFFHITARGVNRGTIFMDQADRIAFLKILDTACERYAGVCVAYCLMGNHYHLLLQSVDGRTSFLMQHLNGSYGRWFNRRRGRSGHLFQGRYDSTLVEQEAYLLEAVRYIELNPCRARLVADPVDWEWSSFRIRMGLTPGLACLDPDLVLGMFGSADFVRHHAERAEQLSRRQQVARHQRIAGRPSLEALFASAASPTERRRQAAIAFKRHGYTLGAIGRYLGVHSCTVGRWVRRD